MLGSLGSLASIPPNSRGISPVSASRASTKSTFTILWESSQEVYATRPPRCVGLSRDTALGAPSSLSIVGNPQVQKANPVYQYYQHAALVAGENVEVAGYASNEHGPASHKGRC